MKLWPRSLLWRTVLLIAALLIAAQLAALQLFRLSEREPRVREIAQQLASVVNLTRAALVSSDPRKRRDLLSELSEREGIRIYVAGETDPPPVHFQPPWLPLMQDELRRLLGPDTRGVFVPGHGGTLWVSFSIDDDAYWVAIPRAQLERPFPWRWVGWIAAVLALALLGAYVLVSRINRPLRRLTAAAVRLGRGETPEPLAEDGPDEVRALTRAFNQMTTDLARLDSDRALLLAGVSHDLRTPLSRLRVEIEMLPADAGSKQAMVQDIEDMDAIIGQFLAFVKEGAAEPKQPADLNALARAAAERFERLGQKVRVDAGALPPLPLGPTAMARLISNLLDNAFKYGRMQGEPTADVTLQTWRQGEKVFLSVLDRGPGIPESEFARLKKPFTRLDASRSNAAGSGLGLAIVERIARQHGGQLWLMPRAGGGLEARIELPIAEAI